ncbi:AAA family ATPase [Pseudomonas sp. P66]|uniref:AAA family ATPase n=2 Tax=Pseudomonas arcuscaelestis TaxID=2710591 RepID=A0ABS2C0V1_9PSED|nr:AAA family ATPase [Pseudomonas arcuscaelestis]
MHRSTLASQKVELVMAHELFGFSEELKGVGKLPIFVGDHPLVPKANDAHVFNKSLVRRILLSMKGGDTSFLLEGDKGTGKSSLVTQLHNRLNKPMINITGSNGVDDTHLLGCKTIKGGDVQEVDGVLSYAYRHGLSCLIDELCTLRPGVLVGINDILQGDGVINLKHHGIDPTLDPRELLNVDGGMTIVKHPLFRLFATDNTGGKQQRDARFVGVNAQNSAVRSRMTSFKVGFMTPEEEMKALKGAADVYAAKRQVTPMDNLFIQQLVEFAFRFRKAFAMEEACDNISFREIQRWAYKWMMYSDADESFVDAIYTNLEETDRVLALETFESVFSRKLILPEEHAYSVGDVADKFIQQNVDAAKAALVNAA